MAGQLTIAIDFDDTFTADPTAWNRVIVTLQECGHRVVCVSARRNEFSHREQLRESLPDGVEILLSYDTPKRMFARANGVEVDIWIDDMPEAIPNRNEMERFCG